MLRRGREPVGRRRGQGVLRPQLDRRPVGSRAGAGSDADGVITAELDRAHMERIRSSLPSLANRQPAAYTWPAGSRPRRRSGPLRRRLHARQARAPARTRGYRAAGEHHGLTLDPDRYPEARAAAVEDLEHHPELEHDEEIWIRFTEDIVRGMGGDGPRVREIAEAITAGWLHSANFELYEDVLPVLAALRESGSGSAWSRTRAAI